MTDQVQPLVSVLMTAYNRSDYIGEAIESVLASTYTHFELLILDDCSTDNTVAIARGYEQKDSRVKVFLNANNLKDYANRNEAASKAKGKYIKYLDSDDAIFPEGLEFCVRTMERFPEAGMGMVFFQRYITGEEPVCWEPEKIIRHHFFVRGCLNVGPSGTIIRRDVFESLGGFDTRFKVASDNFFNIKLASLYPVVLLPREFFFYRVHDGQEHTNKRGYLKYNHLYLKEIVEKIKLPLSAGELQILKKRVDKSFAKELIRHFVKTKSLNSLSDIMQGTNYTFGDMIKSILLK